MAICGDDLAALTVATTLIADLGASTAVVGGLGSARQLEEAADSSCALSRPGTTPGSVDRLVTQYPADAAAALIDRASAPNHRANRSQAGMDQGLRQWRMIGLSTARRATTVKPALAKALAVPGNTFRVAPSTCVSIG